MYMIDMRLDPQRLVAHAQSLGHNHTVDEDLGYALHGWMEAALGEHRPSCFRVIQYRDDALRVLGYTKADADTLRTHALSFAPPLATAVCNWDDAASKSMDAIAWRSGQTVGFEVRVCPVVRGKAGEKDAFLASLPDDATPVEKGRAEIYQEWLTDRLGESVSVRSARLEAFRLASTWRRQHNGQGKAKGGRRVMRPDALMTGRLAIVDPDGFHRLLSHGVGRHRAFGFGMLLLRPA